MVMSQVERPDVVVVLDDTLLKDPDTVSGLNSEGWLVVNSQQHPEDLKCYGEFNIASADATSVCQELGLIVSGLTVVNTAILGAFIRATKIVDLTSLEKVIRERFSKNTIDINLAAITKTCEITKLHKIR
jgi:2-oxoacid:acceptor oxidoreductase gamma subunit (pyruvate/2-ketoisovalerate family)